MFDPIGLHHDPEQFLVADPGLIATRLPAQGRSGAGEQSRMARGHAAGFHQHLMAVQYDFAHAAGRQTNTVFVVLYLLASRLRLV